MTRDARPGTAARTEPHPGSLAVMRIAPPGASAKFTTTVILPAVSRLDSWNATPQRAAARLTRVVRVEPPAVPPRRVGPGVRHGRVPRSPVAPPARRRSWLRWDARRAAAARVPSLRRGRRAPVDRPRALPLRPPHRI